MLTVPKPVLVALGVVIAVVLITGVVNAYGGSLGHMPYIAALWTIIAMIGLVVYYTARSVIQRLRQ